MTRRILTACVNFLLFTFGAIALLSVYAEVERQDEVALHKMQKQRASSSSVAWRDLDEAGCRMTACERIGKR